MKKTILTASVAVALLMTSCSTTNHSYRATKINGNNVISNSTIVDSDVNLDKKVETTSSKRNSVGEAVDEAYYKAITENEVDFVVDPIFEVKTSDKILWFGGKSTAKLTGWGGKYTNSRSKIEAINELSKIDTLDIKKYNAIYNGTGTFNNEETKEKSKVGFFGLLFK